MNIHTTQLSKFTHKDNAKKGGRRRATVHGIANIQTQPSDWACTQILIG